ncbi:MAG: deoxyribose-phosphate aldolase [Paracoccaceae bacterium]|jgi:deoxyribose-phosphate aldolase
MTDLEDAARRALACLDLTNLDDDCNEAAIDALIERAVTPYGSVAAICIWPRFVSYARARLAPDVKIATVVNFPTGTESDEDVIAMTEQAIIDGADEIDMVIPWRALLEGSPEQIPARVERVKRAAGDARVKAILETGVLEDADLIRRASDLALEGGADFIKTSTGKVAVNATLSAAEIMLEAIRDHDPSCGFKAAGGIRTTQDAANYLDAADRIMGLGWADPQHFRIGASSVLTALIATLNGDDDDAVAAEGY